MFFSSVKEYLMHVSTERLEKFLRDCADGTITEDFSNAFPDVESELNRRKQLNAQETSRLD